MHHPLPTCLNALFHAQAQASSRLHRFYVSEKLSLPLEPTYIVDGEEARHAIKALRLKEADQIELCDGLGGTLRCVVSALDRSGACKLLASPLPETLKETPWSGPEWVLAVGCLTLKGGRSEWLVEKATEIGAREFVPLSTERSLVSKVREEGHTREGVAC
jgi:16S rRNA (uracil1498-N3)-methyltransferase